MATATFGFVKYGADKLTKTVRSNWWNRGNINAFMRYLGKAPTTNVGIVANRVFDVTNVAESIGLDALYSFVQSNNASKKQEVIVIEIVLPEVIVKPKEKVIK